MIGYVVVDLDGTEIKVEFEAGEERAIKSLIGKKDVDGNNLYNGSKIEGKFNTVAPCMNAEVEPVTVTGHIEYSELYSAYVLKCELGELLLYKISDIKRLEL